MLYNKNEQKYVARLKVADDTWIHCIDQRDKKAYLFGSGCHDIDLESGSISRNYLHDLKLSPKEYLSKIGFIWADFALPDEKYLLGNDHGKLMIWDIRQNTIREVQSCGTDMPFSNFIYRIILSHKDDHYYAVGGSGCYRIS